ncbi:hypothetical protein PVAP13_1KG324605 [Panicum virgatum]|uniref:Uncharacterized protein n=1 Tax=Panicum virgatum TaxID=38727 RepID=A0A8T0XJ43_PANVG|nr:hypothetical protein PVAP13_1KG324605 [Panicum virgatum]
MTCCNNIYNTKVGSIPWHQNVPRHPKKEQPSNWAIERPPCAGRRRGDTLRPRPRRPPPRAPLPGRRRRLLLAAGLARRRPSSAPPGSGHRPHEPAAAVRHAGGPPPAARREASPAAGPSSGRLVPARWRRIRSAQEGEREREWGGTERGEGRRAARRHAQPSLAPAAATRPARLTPPCAPPPPHAPAGLRARRGPVVAQESRRRLLLAVAPLHCRPRAPLAILGCANGRAQGSGGTPGGSREKAFCPLTTWGAGDRSRRLFREGRGAEGTDPGALLWRARRRRRWVRDADGRERES